MALPQIILKVDFNGATAYYDDRTDHLAAFGVAPALLKGSLEVIYPDGIKQSLSDGFLPANGFMASLPVRGNGSPMKGLYSFYYKLMNGAALVKDVTLTVDYSPEALVPMVEVDADLFSASAYANDVTDYERDGYSHSFTSRVMSYTSLSGAGMSSNGTLDLSVVGVLYTGTYRITMQSGLSYFNENGWFSYNESFVYEDVATINYGIMLPDLIELIRQFNMKLLSQDCCKDSTYDEMCADFVKLTAIYTSFVNSGQAGVLTGLEAMREEMLVLITKWCNVDTTEVEGTPIGDYEFCLCEGGAGGTRHTYNAGNGAQITASVTGITFAKALGVGTFTFPVGGGTIYGGTIAGSGAEAVYDMNGVTNSFKLVLSTPNANAAYASMLAGLMEIISTANSGSIDDESPLVYDSGAVQKYITGITSNTISIVLGGIGATYSDGWALAFQIP